MTHTDTRTIALGANGSTVEILARPTQTGGAASLYRWRLAPTSRGPAPHRHTTFDDTFVVETGEIDYYDGTTWRTLRPGDTAHAPRGGVHALRKTRPEPATVLMLLTPGVPREDYFAALATTDEHDLPQLHARHDNHPADEHPADEHHR